jgi:methyl-accepting chemotaxis protein
MGHTRELDEAVTPIVVLLVEDSAAIRALVRRMLVAGGHTVVEAARAGEAGKGFAVVAGEVKELAKATATATAGITTRIEAIQADTQAAVAAIAQISGIIAQINETQTAIAAAVEEQTATTVEISRSVAEVATGSAGIADSITGLARVSAQTSSGVTDTQQAAGQLARMAADLRQLVGHFTY